MNNNTIRLAFLFQQNDARKLAHDSRRNAVIEGDSSLLFVVLFRGKSNDIQVCTATYMMNQEVEN